MTFYYNYMTMVEVHNTWLAFLEFLPFPTYVQHATVLLHANPTNSKHYDVCRNHQYLNPVQSYGPI